jgi:hypothetical protein
MGSVKQKIDAREMETALRAKAKALLGQDLTLLIKVSPQLLKRIQWALEWPGMDQGRFSKICGFNHTVLSKILHCGEQKKISVETARKIYAGIKALEWLESMSRQAGGTHPRLPVGGEK